MLLIAYKPSCAMYGAIFKIARFVSVTTLPAFGSYTAYNKYKDNQKEVMELEPVTEDAVIDWFDAEKKKLNISDIKLLKGKRWASCNYGKTGYIEAPSDHIIQLNAALINKSINNEITADQDNAKIARERMVLWHEFGHIAHKDYQNGTYALVAIPMAVEALSFGVTSAFRKLCNIQEPKTLAKTVLRSSAAIGSIIPKAFISIVSTMLLHRYHESRADKFACEHAESRLELEEFAKWHEKRESPYATGSRNDIRFAEFEKDPSHPAPVDRKEMVEAYIDQWDAAHK